MIPHSCSHIEDADLHAVEAVMRSNFVGYGRASHALEEWYKERTGRKYAFAVQSGTQALTLALSSLSLPAGSRVGLPVLTCRSVRSAILANGLTPALADVDIDDLTIAIPGTAADWASMVVPHAYGAPCDLDRAAALGIPWIEDCATSPATTWKDLPVGRCGTLSIFSFNGTKYVTGGCGGMVLTDREDCAERIENLLSGEGGDNHQCLTAVGRMPALNAALALAQSERMNDFLAYRRSLAAIYDDCLSSGPDHGLHLPSRGKSHSYYRYVVRLPFRASFAAACLRAAGIDARVSVNDWLDGGEKDASGNAGRFPAADAWRESLLSLPIHMQVSGEMARQISGTLATCLAQHGSGGASV
ncbi:MAG: DegT/DnrJ/EryC1/StrS aminotransferase family protein [Nitrosomonadales bacterium]|nr:DegT/DnrJ/EryC1/StrS aminotransferase family protein [Nitrosomonadales bacterium]